MADSWSRVGADCPCQLQEESRLNVLTREEDSKPLAQILTPLNPGFPQTAIFSPHLRIRVSPDPAPTMTPTEYKEVALGYIQLKGGKEEQQERLVIQEEGHSWHKVTLEPCNGIALAVVAICHNNTWQRLSPGANSAFSLKQKLDFTTC